VQSGWSHARVAGTVMALGTVVAVVAAWSIRAGNVAGQWTALGFAVR